MAVAQATHPGQMNKQNQQLGKSKSFCLEGLTVRSAGPRRCRQRIDVSDRVTGEQGADISSSQGRMRAGAGHARPPARPRAGSLRGKSGVNSTWHRVERAVERDGWSGGESVCFCACVSVGGARSSREDGTQTSAAEIRQATEKQPSRHRGVSPDAAVAGGTGHSPYLFRLPDIIRFSGRPD